MIEYLCLHISNAWAGCMLYIKQYTIHNKIYTTIDLMHGQGCMLYIKKYTIHNKIYKTIDLMHGQECMLYIKQYTIHKTIYITIRHIYFKAFRGINRSA